MEKLFEKVVKMYDQAREAAMVAAKAADEQHALSLKNEGAMYAYNQVAILVKEALVEKENDNKSNEPSKEAADDKPNA